MRRRHGAAHILAKAAHQGRQQHLGPLTATVVLLIGSPGGLYQRSSGAASITAKAVLQHRPRSRCLTAWLVLPTGRRAGRTPRRAGAAPTRPEAAMPARTQGSHPRRRRRPRPPRRPRRLPRPRRPRPQSPRRKPRHVSRAARPNRRSSALRSRGLVLSSTS